MKPCIVAASSFGLLLFTTIGFAQVAGGPVSAGESISVPGAASVGGSVSAGGPISVPGAASAGGPISVPGAASAGLEEWGEGPPTPQLLRGRRYRERYRNQPPVYYDGNGIPYWPGISAIPDDGVVYPMRPYNVNPAPGDGTINYGKPLPVDEDGWPQWPPYSSERPVAAQGTAGRG